MLTKKLRSMRGFKPRKHYLAHLRKSGKVSSGWYHRPSVVSFLTDVYSPSASLTRPSLEIVQHHGMAICVLTKGGSRALADIDLYRPDRDCFAAR